MSFWCVFLFYRIKRVCHTQFFYKELLNNETLTSVSKSDYRIVCDGNWPILLLLIQEFYFLLDLISCVFIS